LRDRISDITDVGKRILRNLSGIEERSLEDLDEKTLTFAKELSKYQLEFLIAVKSMLTIMNKKYLKSCFDIEEEYGKVAYDTNKKSMKEFDEFIKSIYNRYI